jgi:hypothetical protein
VSDADRGGAGIAVVPIAAKDNGRPDISAPIARPVCTREKRPRRAAERAGLSGGGERAEGAQHLYVFGQRRERRDDARLVVATLEVDKEHVSPKTLAART